MYTTWSVLFVSSLVAQCRQLARKQSRQRDAGKTAMVMSNAVSLIVPCIAADSCHVQFGKKKSSEYPGDELDAALTPEAFLLIFGEDAASDLTATILHALSSTASQVPFDVDGRAEARGQHHSLSQCAAKSEQHRASGTLKNLDNMPSALSVSVKGVEVDRSTVSPEPKTDMEQENMQYFFILARGTRRVICTPAPLHTAETALPRQRISSARPVSTKQQRHPLVQARQCTQRASNATASITSPARPRPASATHGLQRNDPVQHSTPATKPARPRSAVLMDIMSTQISGPISVAQVLHGELTDISIHDEVQAEWGVPPLAASSGHPPQPNHLTPSAALAGSVLGHVRVRGRADVRGLPLMYSPPPGVVRRGCLDVTLFGAWLQSSSSWRGQREGGWWSCEARTSHRRYSRLTAFQSGRGHTRPSSRPLAGSRNSSSGPTRRRPPLPAAAVPALAPPAHHMHLTVHIPTIHAKRARATLPRCPTAAARQEVASAAQATQRPPPGRRAPNREGPERAAPLRLAGPLHGRSHARRGAAATTTARTSLRSSPLTPPAAAPPGARQPSAGVKTEHSVGPLRGRRQPVAAAAAATVPRTVPCHRPASCPATPCRWRAACTKSLATKMKVYWEM